MSGEMEKLDEQNIKFMAERNLEGLTAFVGRMLTRVTTAEAERDRLAAENARLREDNARLERELDAMTVAAVALNDDLAILASTSEVAP